MNDYTILDEGLLTFIQKTILKYCNYTNNRLYIIDNNNILDMDIIIDFKGDNTYIKFVFGNKNLKKIVLEDVRINYIVDFNELKNTIDYLFNDHQIIQAIDFNEYNALNMTFAIEWNENKLCGLECNNINLNINFHHNTKLSREYFFSFLQNYKHHLDKIPSFIKMKDNYFNNIKAQYIDLLNRSELLNLISKMDNDELRCLLKKTDNEVIFKNQYEEKEKVKKLYK